MRKFFANPSSLQDLSPDLLGPFLESQNISHAKFEEAGHTSLTLGASRLFHISLVVELHTAMQVGTHLVGSGSCGVSQFVAAGLGRKQRIDPASISLWEEDLPLLACYKRLGISGETIGAFSTNMPTSCTLCKFLVGVEATAAVQSLIPAPYAFLQEAVRNYGLTEQLAAFVCDARQQFEGIPTKMAVEGYVNEMLACGVHGP